MRNKGRICRITQDYPAVTSSSLVQKCIWPGKLGVTLITQSCVTWTSDWHIGNRILKAILYCNWKLDKKMLYFFTIAQCNIESAI